MTKPREDCDAPEDVLKNYKYLRFAIGMLGSMIENGERHTVVSRELLSKATRIAEELLWEKKREMEGGAGK